MALALIIKRKTQKLMQIHLLKKINKKWIKQKKRIRMKMLKIIMMRIIQKKRKTVKVNKSEAL
jgi:hypothetical protein